MPKYTIPVTRKYVKNSEVSNSTTSFRMPTYEVDLLKEYAEELGTSVSFVVVRELRKLLKREGKIDTAKK